LLSEAPSGASLALLGADLLPLHYPVSELVRRVTGKRGGETSDFEQVYARFEPSRRERPSYWGQLPWAN
jgi:hypothetical protein